MELYEKIYKIEELMFQYDIKNAEYNSLLITIGNLLRSAKIRTVSELESSLSSEKTNLASDGEIWSAIRTLLAQGEAIYQDYKDKPYEEYSARLDAAARERVEWLKTKLRKAR